jgi:hypothetical protein
MWLQQQRGSAPQETTMNEDLMLVIDRIVDAGGDWPSQEEAAAALAEMYAEADRRKTFTQTEA